MIATRSQFRGMTLWLISIFFSLVSCWGEGSIDTMVNGGGTSVPKPHGLEPHVIYGSCQAKNNMRVTKRSYKRALNRVQLHGWTWYRGQLLSRSTLTTFPKCEMTKKQSTSSNVAPTKLIQRKRLTCLSRNAGGLSQADWDTVQYWLSQQQLDVFLIQESHWTYCFHSGIPGRQAGLLCMVNRRLCHAHQISWRVMYPGRLIHIRLHGVHHHIDLLNLYQYVGTGRQRTYMANIGRFLDQCFQTQYPDLYGRFQHISALQIYCCGHCQLCIWRFSTQGIHSC